MNEEIPTINSGTTERSEGVEQPQEEFENSDPEVKYKSDFENRRGTLTDEWEINKDLPGDTTQHPLFAITRDALGLSRNSAITQTNEMEQVVNLAVNTLHTDDPTAIFNYLSNQIRHANGKSMRAIILRLKTMKEELS